jgi:hypothetical protein
LVFENESWEVVDLGSGDPVWLGKTPFEGVRACDQWTARGGETELGPTIQPRPHGSVFVNESQGLVVGYWGPILGGGNPD